MRKKNTPREQTDRGIVMKKRKVSNVFKNRSLESIEVYKTLTKESDQVPLSLIINHDFMF